MKALITILLLLLVIPSNYSVSKSEKKALHPVHVSFTTIEYFEKERQYKILFKIFADDFDLIINKTYNKNIKLAEGRWENSYLKPIDSYIQNNFRLTDSNDKKITIKFENQEIKEQAVWLYYKAKYKTNVGKFVVLNNLILDLYPDQKNLLIFVFRGKTKALQFNHNNIRKEINF